ncbi:unnamed protein product [Nyctereutes procyonoides]|uniref:(raccoon dog) hypothetical protein n=1 Tax=Nyctereutes procyonoides TaxID=34880 RepID=A0A811YYF1_NYCPR|nr:unnamed protein product [Nyctereutes procyonoides]
MQSLTGRDTVSLGLSKTSQGVVKANGKREIYRRSTCHLPSKSSRLCLQREPKYPQKNTPRRNKLGCYAIKFPLTMESAMKKIEDNTLVFIVHLQLNKHQSKQAVRELSDVDLAKVNTQIRPHGERPYVGLFPDYDALDVANKIGII